MSASSGTAPPYGIDPIAALRESERRFRAISACTYDWESWHDPCGRLQWVNVAVHRMTGYSVEECLAMNDYPLPIICPSDREQISNVLQLAATGVPGNDVEFRILTKQGYECWAAISWQLITDEDGINMGFRTSVRDISERKNMEQQIRVYAENLEQLVKERTARLMELEVRRAKVDQLAALGQLAAGVAHEINNPLAGIRNAMELIRNELPQEFENRPLIDLVQSEIDRMGGIIRQLYQLYRPQPTWHCDVDLINLASQTIQLLSAHMRRHKVHMAITNATQKGSLLASLPESELKQVLYNILLNAVQASPPGSQVAVTINDNGSFASIQITDQGPGIAPDVLPKIFDPFFTTKHGIAQPGMGLGLSVSQSLIQALGGKIDVDTQWGHGTTFVVTVPKNSAGTDSNGVQRAQSIAETKPTDGAIQQ